MVEPTDSWHVVNLRLYGFAFLPALIAALVGMFSLEGVPSPIGEAVSTGTYQGDGAAAAARQVIRLAAERPAGSAGDERVADFLIERFKDVRAGAVSEQRFEAEVDGEEVALRNVLITLPGDLGRTIVIVAGRDAPRAPGAASSAAATGALLELAGSLGIGGHDATYVLASTSGGAAGVEHLVDALLDRGPVEAVIALSQPGTADPTQPYLLTSSTGTRTASIQLRRTAAQAIDQQVGAPPTHPSAFESLARLAIPSGLGPQAALIAEGIDAVTITAAGERQLSPSADAPEDLSERTLDAFGRAVQVLIGEVDLSPQLEHGPSTYVEVGDNLVPGWSLSALALCLVLPALIAAVDGCARASRRARRLGRGFAWAAARSLPAVGALAILYGLALVGVVPRPPFPFDPALHPVGAAAAISIGLVVIVALASALGLRALRITGGAAPLAALPALGALTCLAALGLWLANPYLALFAVPIAHLWVLADAEPGRTRGALVTLAAVIACLPVIAAIAAVASSLDLGADTPWTLAIMVADGQLGLAVTLAACFLAGGVLGAIALASARGRDIPPARNPTPA
jgi:hypothetical protein